VGNHMLTSFSKQANNAKHCSKHAKAYEALGLVSSVHSATVLGSGEARVRVF
jgi:hypothetical protein